MNKITKTLMVVVVSLVICIVVLGYMHIETDAGYRVDKSDANTSSYIPSPTTEPYPTFRGKKVRNIIFCIGDGMALSQIRLRGIV